jgi:hypothetical protein
MLFFVLLTLFELAALKWLGFDVLAHLVYAKTAGKLRRFYFEAFGAVAFVMVQPLIFLWIFSRLSEDLRDRVMDAARAIVA